MLVRIHYSVMLRIFFQCSACVMLVRLANRFRLGLHQVTYFIFIHINPVSSSNKVRVEFGNKLHAENTCFYNVRKLLVPNRHINN